MGYEPVVSLIDRLKTVFNQIINSLKDLKCEKVLPIQANKEKC